MYPQVAGLLSEAKLLLIEILAHNNERLAESVDEANTTQAGGAEPDG